MGQLLTKIYLQIYAQTARIWPTSSRRILVHHIVHPNDSLRRIHHRLRLEPSGPTVLPLVRRHASSYRNVLRCPPLALRHTYRTARPVHPTSPQTTNRQLTHCPPNLSPMFDLILKTLFTIFLTSITILMVLLTISFLLSLISQCVIP